MKMYKGKQINKAPSGTPRVRGTHEGCRVAEGSRRPPPQPLFPDPPERGGVNVAGRAVRGSTAHILLLAGLLPAHRRLSPPPLSSSARQLSSCSLPPQLFSLFYTRRVTKFATLAACCSFIWPFPLSFIYKLLNHSCTFHKQL